MSAKVKFTKMHGLGNDFIVIDCINHNFTPNKQWIRMQANRRTGIGFDQLLLVCKANDPKSDFAYRIFNADGQEVNQCGNGARCFARFVYAKGLTTKKHIKVATHDNYYEMILNDDGLVNVNMQQPIFDPALIPFTAQQQALIYELKSPIGNFNVAAVSMGNPHCVLVVDNLRNVDVGGIGEALSVHPQFPQATNVEFIRIDGPNEISMRVYERGVGETAACGSGACAAAVIAIRDHQLQNPVTVNMPGGALQITWEGKNHPVWMKGPAEMVFEGEVAT